MGVEFRMDSQDEASARNFFLIDTASPEAVGRASFPLVRRGFDPIEVQGFARAVAAELTVLHQELADLRSTLADAERRAAVGIDDDVVLEYLGEESARLLADARSTAQTARARAEDHSTRTVAKAESEAHSIRAAAQTYSADVHKAADKRAKEVGAEADRNARSLVMSAKAESDELIRTSEARAAQMVAAAEARAAQMVAAAEERSAKSVAAAEERSAQLVADAERERATVLSDLSERRAALTAQLDRQLASRDALREMISRTVRYAADALDELDEPVGPEEELAPVSA